ncbi:hypothetical protein TNCV_3087261 [Trichonephila clavipes]|nr:hypothetical protein TNCV_3087261 [Trichonephila clavipes]
MVSDFSSGSNQLSYNKVTGVQRLFPYTNSAGLKPVLSCVTVRRVQPALDFPNLGQPQCTIPLKFVLLFCGNAPPCCSGGGKLNYETPDTFMPNLLKNSTVKRLMKNVPSSV